mmetsp:Transcript_67506/g.197478  ORF Transcript_67506/g.197478 Transcript_67506/m.197478 type:complete len:324 (-) Transcript_67506:19-990(-)
MAKHVQQGIGAREAVGDAHPLVLLTRRLQSLGDGTSKATTHVGMEDGVIPLIWQLHAMQEQPQNVQDEPHRVHQGSVDENVPERHQAVEVAEEEDPGPGLMHASTLPAHDVQHQGGEKVDEDGGRVVHVVEDQRVAHGARGQQQGAAAQAPGRGEDAAPQVEADIRVQEAAAGGDQRKHGPYEQKVGHPAKVEPVEVLLEWGGGDLALPAQGEEHQDLPHVDDPEVLGDGSKAPSNEERVGDAEDELVLRQPLPLQLLASRLHGVQAAVHNGALLRRDVPPAFAAIIRPEAVVGEPMIWYQRLVGSHLQCSAELAGRRRRGGA